MKSLNIVLGYLVVSLFGSFIFNLLLGHPGENWLLLRLAIMGIVLIPYALTIFLARIDTPQRKNIYKWLGIILVALIVTITILTIFGSNVGGGAGYGFLVILFVGVPALIVLAVASILARFIHSAQPQRTVYILTFLLITLIILNSAQFFTLAGLFE